MSRYLLAENPCKLLDDAVTDETFSDVLDLGGVMDMFTLQVNHSANLTGGVVQILGSLDGVNFDATPVIASGALSGVGPTFVYAKEKPVRYLKARIETVVTSAAPDPTVDVYVAASQVG